MNANDCEFKDEVTELVEFIDKHGGHIAMLRALPILIKTTTKVYTQGYFDALTTATEIVPNFEAYLPQMEKAMKRKFKK